MMNGNYGGGGMGGGMGGGWMMIIGVFVCIALIVAVIWLVTRLLKNRQAPPFSSLPQQQQPYQMHEQGYQPPPSQSTETYQEDEKQYSYPQQEQPLE